ncbi:unnamed protein product [Prunus armeniaca]|uniref:Glycosyltransferase n=1 Tax=Prunus armeniaca TaxID=36596 RepID=A0A6J5U5N6_PRUAR|nr:unnamed protein product [Prunus armeniaca]
MEQSKGRRLIFFPLPLQGHINPMLELASVLHSKGFSITIMHTHLNSLNPSSYPHFTFHSIPDGLSESEASTKDIVLLISLLNVKCVEPFRAALADLLSNVSKEPVACLIAVLRFHFTQSVAESFKLPRMLLRTGGATSLLVYTQFPLLHEKGYLPKQDSRLEEPVVEFPPLKVKDLPVIHTLDPEKYYQLVAGRLKTEVKASSGLIFNSFEDIEGNSLATIRQEFPVPIFPIGPYQKRFTAASSSSSLLSLSHDQSCISWLNTQAPKSVVYVSFGSLATLNEAKFLEIAWGLANSSQPFLWVVRSGLFHGPDPFPGGFLEGLNGRGHIVKWAPQKQVLAHPAVGVFFSHNGWNSTLESICEGIPMICMPCSADQMMNARYVSDVWKVGLQLEHGVERNEIAKTIRKLMVEKQGEDIKDTALKLMEKATLCFKEAGSSYQSLDSLVKHILSITSFAFGRQSE